VKEELEIVDTRQRTTLVLAAPGYVVVTSTIGTCAAAARGMRSQDGGARLCRRTYFARRPLGAAVTRAGIGKRWPHELLGEPAPRAGGVLVIFMTARGAKEVMTVRQMFVRPDDEPCVDV
jgi:hypothetical protein